MRLELSQTRLPRVLAMARISPPDLMRVWLSCARFCPIHVHQQFIRQGFAAFSWNVEKAGNIQGCQSVQYSTRNPFLKNRVPHLILCQL